jgi:NADPH:quinone reductase-like Zn-dependent oxidoreductase
MFYVAQGCAGPAQKAAPKGVDVLYDPVGGEPFQEALKTVNWGAQILIIGFASGTIPKVPTLDLLSLSEKHLCWFQTPTKRFCIMINNRCLHAWLFRGPARRLSPVLPPGQRKGATSISLVGVMVLRDLR